MTTSLRLVSGYNGLMAVTILPGQFFDYDRLKKWSLISCALSAELSQLVANDGISQIRIRGWAGPVTDPSILQNTPIFDALVACNPNTVLSFQIQPPASGQEMSFKLFGVNAATGAETQIRLEAGTSIAHMVFSYGQ